jgi:hypothetical protein
MMDVDVSDDRAGSRPWPFAASLVGQINVLISDETRADRRRFLSLDHVSGLRR